MKKVEPEVEMRPSYVREDFGKLERGKYAARMAASSNVVVLEPELAKAFPNEASVDEALRGLLELAEKAARLTHRPARRAAKG